MHSVEQARQEVQNQMQHAVELAASPTPRPAGEMEQALWTVLLGIGRALMALYFAGQAERWGLGRRYRHEGRTFEVVEHESWEAGTRFGKVACQRPAGRDVANRRRARDLPLNREVGLAGGFTMPVVLLVTRLCAQMAFASARTLFKSMLGWAPSPRAVLRMVDAAGQHAVAFSEQAEPLEEDGEVLVIVVDSKGAPSMSSREQARRRRRRSKGNSSRHDRRRRRREFPKTRRGPGKKSKNAKMATVGVLYSLRRTPDGKLDGPFNKYVLATFDGDRALFTRLRAEAERRGYGTAKFKVVQFISDGARPLHKLQSGFFPDAERCLDWIHAVEYLWKVGKAICRNTRRERAELEAWVRLRKRLQALANTAMTGPGNKYRRKVLTKTIDYFRQNASAMNYRALRTRDSRDLQWSRRGGRASRRRSSAGRAGNALGPRPRRGRPAAPLHPGPWSMVSL